MDSIEQAYISLGLPRHASREELERRFQMLVRQSHAQKLRGMLSAKEEEDLDAAAQAYRDILKEETRRRSEAYRIKHYSKFKRYAGLAESIDHYFYYHKFQLFCVSLLVIFVLLGTALFTMLKPEQAVSANLSAPDLTLVVAGISMQQDQRDEVQPDTLEQSMLKQVPNLQHIHPLIWKERANPDKKNPTGLDRKSVIALLSVDPDLYIVDRDRFVTLMRLGILRKLEKWGTYGIDLSGGSLPSILHSSSEPMIAAIPTDAKHPESALKFIHAYLGEDKNQLEEPGIAKPH